MSIRDQIEQQAEATSPVIGGLGSVAMPVSGTGIPYLPFPIEALPSELGAIAEQAARAIGCDPAMVALPALTGIGVAIGNTRLLAIKNSWRVAPIIWTLLGVPSGNQKSPAGDITFDYFRGRQDKLSADYRRQQAAENAKQRKERGPVDPKVVWADDATTEGLSAAMATNPRGILFACDEIGNWLGSMGLYKKNGGIADVSRYCQLYGGRSTNILRKDKDRQTTHAGGVLGITGATTLAILRRLADNNLRESGLLARLLPCCPPTRPRRWTDEDVAPETKQAFYDLLDRLFQLRDANGRPGEVSLSPEAMIRWQQFFNGHNEEKESLTCEDLRAAWSKLEELPCRLALILHESEGGGPKVSLDAMGRAITLTEWFKHESRRVYAMLFGHSKAPAAVPAATKLLEWMKGRGSVSARDVSRAVPSFRVLGGADAARAVLEELVAGGTVESVDQPSGTAGGAPTTKYRLVELSQGSVTLPPAQATQPSETRTKPGCVTVAAVTEAEKQSESNDLLGQFLAMTELTPHPQAAPESRGAGTVDVIHEEGQWMKL